MRTISFITTLVVILAIGAVPSFASERIKGSYCYTYGDMESLMVAKEISYTMALRKAIETYRTFISSTTVVKDFKLKQDIIENIASGYVDNIRIVSQGVNGRTVCTELVGSVNPDAVRSIISRKVEKTGFKGLVSNEYIKILSYKTEGGWLSILYQAKQHLTKYQINIIVDCFDKDGMPIEGTYRSVPSGAYLSKGEVRKTRKVGLPRETASFELRLE